jgi:hypothetical protein
MKRFVAFVSWVKGHFTSERTRRRFRNRTPVLPTQIEQLPRR